MKKKVNKVQVSTYANQMFDLVRKNIAKFDEVDTAEFLLALHQVTDEVKFQVYENREQPVNDNKVEKHFWETKRSLNYRGLLPVSLAK